MKSLSIGATVLLLAVAGIAFPVNPLWGALSLAAAICSAATYFVYRKQAKSTR